MGLLQARRKIDRRVQGAHKKPSLGAPRIPSIDQEEAMTEREPMAAASFPYATHLNILFPHLQKIDVPVLVDAVSDQWYNQTLCKVNDSVVRLGVMQGEDHWHKHDDDDEFFFCLA